MGDYVSLAYFKAWKHVSLSTDDVVLEGMITAAENYFNKKTGTVFRIRKPTWRRFDAVRDVYQDELHLDYNLVKDTQIINGDGSTVAVADRQLLTPNSPPYWGIRLLSGSWTYHTHSADAIRVRGYWGYSLKAPPDVVEAICELTAYYYAGKDSQQFETASFHEGGILVVPKGVPANVIDKIYNYRRAGVAK